MNGHDYALLSVATRTLTEELAGGRCQETAEFLAGSLHLVRYSGHAYTNDPTLRLALLPKISL